MEYMENGLEQEGPEEQSNNKIINSLNPDCWCLILDKLSVRELLVSERTCKDWQKMVLEHISHRKIFIYGRYNVCEQNELALTNSLKHWNSFKLWAKKCGRAVHGFQPGHCFKDCVDVLREYCPNIEFIELKDLKEKLSPWPTQSFHDISSVTLTRCDEFTDNCVAQLASNAYRITISSNKRLTGRFLKNIKLDNLRFLHIYNCRAFRFPFLLSIANRLIHVTILLFWKINRSKIEIKCDLHLLLDKMPQLSSISFMVNDIAYNYDRARSVRDSDVFIDSLCQLRNVERIDANFEIEDHHLEAVVRSCEEVVDIKFRCDYITSRGLEVMCGLVGPQLREFNLSRCPLTDDDVVHFVYACPSLEWLDISECPQLAEPVPRIAAARRELNTTRSIPILRLIIRRWDNRYNTEEYKDVLNLRYTREEYSRTRDMT